METKTVKVEDATRDELFDYATIDLGLELHHMLGATKIKAAIHAVKPDFKEFEARVKEPEVEAARPGPVMDIDPDAEMEEPTYEIIIPINGESDGKMPVPVSVNGRNMFIERGVKSIIKHRYMHVLENAIQVRYEQPDGPEGDMIEVHVPAYPVTVVNSPPQDELDAWDAYRARKQAEEVAARLAA